MELQNGEIWGVGKGTRSLTSHPLEYALYCYTSFVTSRRMPFSFSWTHPGHPYNFFLTHQLPVSTPTCRDGSSTNPPGFFTREVLHRGRCLWHLHTAQVWNDTVANLTLMALGSSAPEILLSVPRRRAACWGRNSSPREVK